jgi:hypothetical protein
MAKQAKNGIVYEGPSLIDGKPIVAIALYSDANRKTGGMLQTYILRADVDPRDASKTGEDESICGNCPLRGETTTDPNRKIAKNRRCYVVIGQGPLIAWRAYNRGVYPDARTHDACAELGRGRMVRLGTYGDPAAVPSYVWDSLLADCRGWTAYTHHKPAMPHLAMQSADTLQEAKAHWNAGRRTFRTVESVDDIVPGKEILCPASKEAGARTTCQACGLCAGTSTKTEKSIAIPFH